jgi:hypothetical protein
LLSQTVLRISVTELMPLGIVSQTILEVIAPEKLGQTSQTILRLLVKEAMPLG